MKNIQHHVERRNIKHTGPLGKNQTLNSKEIV